jgi:hypothetical protein
VGVCVKRERFLIVGSQMRGLKREIEIAGKHGDADFLAGNQRLLTFWFGYASMGSAKSGAPVKNSERTERPKTAKCQREATFKGR